MSTFSDLRTCCQLVAGEWKILSNAAIDRPGPGPWLQRCWSCPKLSPDARCGHLATSVTSGLGQLDEGLYPWLVLAGCIMLIHVVAKFFSKKRSTSWRPAVFPKRSNHSFDAKEGIKKDEKWMQLLQGFVPGHATLGCVMAPLEVLLLVVRGTLLPQLQLHSPASLCDWAAARVSRNHWNWAASAFTNACGAPFERYQIVWNRVVCDVCVLKCQSRVNFTQHIRPQMFHSF